MKKCIIFCSADFQGLLQNIEEQDCIIAADGGLRHTQSLGITPHLILGDFDSLGYTPAGAAVYPAEKDDTDAMLAVRKGLELGYEEFWLYGSMDGPRLDHTLANFQLLSYLANRNARGYLIGNDYIATVIQNEIVEFPETATGILSLFCMGCDAKGVTLVNLKYPLTNATITSDFPLGVSNQFTGKAASVSVTEGSLLALWHKENAMPQRRSLL